MNSNKNKSLPVLIVRLKFINKCVSIQKVRSTCLLKDKHTHCTPSAMLPLKRTKVHDFLRSRFCSRDGNRRSM